MSVGTLTPSAGRAPLWLNLAAVRSPAGIAVLALIALGAVLRFTGIGHQGFWFDEGNTALLVSHAPGTMLGLIPQTESTPPLYYMLAWAWVQLFGHGEAGLRSFSALVGVAAIPVAYGAAAKLVSQRAGLIVAALTACNPFLIWYSQEARSYSLLVLLSACSLLAFAYARADPRPRPLALWVIACGLALTTHYYAVIVVVPQAAWLLYEHRRARTVLLAIGAIGVWGAALIPLAISQSDTGNDSWIAHSPLGLRLRQIIPQFLIGTNAPERQVLKYIAFALALIGLGLLVRAARGPERRGALLAGGLALAGFVLALLFVAAGVDTLITRNIIGLWLPAAIAVGGGLSAIGAGPRLRTLGAVACAALCVIGIVATVAIATERSMQRPDWRYVARALGPAPAPAERDVAGRAILIQHFRTLLPLSLYMPRLRYLVRRHGAVVRELDVISMVSPGQPLCWWGAACNLIPSDMQAHFDIPGFHEVWRRHVLQWTIVRLVADRPTRVTPHIVSRALQTTTLRRDELLLQRRG